jgi:hypothetical protein
MFHMDKVRAYFHCEVCDLIFVDRHALLEPREEKARYDLHENDPGDKGYRKFLNQLTQPLLTRLGDPPLSGLDFGSGPGPTLSIMLAEAGHTLRIYDPFYAPNPQVLEETYDFVTCSETFEHFNSPGNEWSLLVDLVKPGGWLGIMTLLHPPLVDFPDWHYKNDLTHVSFFSTITFNYLARHSSLNVKFFGNNVILLQKPKDWKPFRQTLSTKTDNLHDWA